MIKDEEATKAKEEEEKEDDKKEETGVRGKQRKDGEETKVKREAG